VTCAFTVGDLVTWDYRPLWYYGHGSLDGYRDIPVQEDFEDSMTQESQRSAEILIGFVIEVVMREEPMGYRVTPGCTYRIKWLNLSDSNWHNTWRTYYEDELKLVSAIEALGARE
jgi:hypothetical protein